MTINLKRNIILTLILILQAAAQAQTWHSVNIRDGLSSMFVLSVYQDCRGYIWAGTYSGLSILDGNGSKVAFTDRPEVKAAAGAMVLGIGGSQDGCVWINTNFGIDCWNIDTGRYEHHPRFSGNYQMSVGPKGQVVILTRNKEFYAYNVRRHRFQPITAEPVDVRDIHAMDIDSTGCWRMITGTHTSEYQLSEKDDGHITATLIRRTIHEVGPLVSAKADNGSLLMINAQGILYQGDLSGRHARMICQLSPKMMQSQPYSAILRDGEDYLIGLYARGIYRLKRTVQGYTEEPTPLTSGIFGIIRDTRQNILWVATDGEGLRYLTHEPYEIHTEPYSRLSFPVSAPIRAILQDSDGNLWAGTKGDGIIQYQNYSPQHIQARQFTRSNSGLLHNSVYTLSQGSHGIIWIGSDGKGINYYDPREQLIKQLDIQHPHLRSVHALTQVNTHELIACTGGDGIFRIHLQWKEGKPHATSLRQLFYDPHLPTSSNFTSVTQRGETLWLANREIGIRSLNLRTGRTQLYRPRTPAVSAQNDPIALCYDSIGDKLVCGMSRGLLVMKGPKPPYTVQDIGQITGLPDATTRAIALEGSRLWAATTQGLAYYDLQTGENSIVNTPHETQIQEPSEGAAYYDARQRLKYFGATGGFIVVSAPLRTPVPYTPPVHFTGINIGDRHIGINQQINLRHNENYLSVSFTAVDYLHADSYLFEYRLASSSDSTWHPIGHARNINFANLKPATYRIQVRYHKGQYVSPASELAFTITPPWYDTAWARLLWILILAGSIAGSIRLYRWQRARSQQIRQMKALTNQLTPYDVVGDRILHREDQLLLEQVFQTVIDHISNPDLSPQLIADKLCMGYRTLYRRLQTISDKTLANIIRDIRMEHAAQLLTQTRMTTEQVAAQVGYVNRGSFHKHFVTRFGCTPRQFQTRLQTELAQSAEKTVQSKDKCSPDTPTGNIIIKEKP